MKKIHIFIILICLLLLSVVYLINKKEGFNSSFSDFNTIDRIKTSDASYAYCIAGNIVSTTGNNVLIKDNYKGGNTYNYLSDNFNLLECKNNFQYNMSGDQLNWKTPTARQISFPFSDEYKGFTVPYSYVPVKIDSEYISFYDKNELLLDNINKCSMLKTESDQDRCLGATKTKISSSSSSSSDNSKSNKKCIANYGTNIGDPLCCEQQGVLQHSGSKNVCGIDKPTCSGYVCGTSYGTCS